MFDAMQDLGVQSVVSFGQSAANSVPLKQWGFRSLSRHGDGVVYTAGSGHLVDGSVVLGNQTMGQYGANIYVEVLNGDREGEIIEHRQKRAGEHTRPVTVSVRVDMLGKDHPTRQKARRLLNQARDVAQSSRSSHGGIPAKRPRPQLPEFLVIGQSDLRISPKMRGVLEDHADDLLSLSDPDRAMDRVGELISDDEELTDEEKAGLAAHVDKVSWKAGRTAISASLLNHVPGGVHVRTQDITPVQCFDRAPIFGHNNLEVNLAPAV